MTTASCVYKLSGILIGVALAEGLVAKLTTPYPPGCLQGMILLVCVNVSCMTWAFLTGICWARLAVTSDGRVRRRNDLQIRQPAVEFRESATDSDVASQLELDTDSLLLADASTLSEGTTNEEEISEDHQEENLTILHGRPDLCSIIRSCYDMAEIQERQEGLLPGGESGPSIPIQVCCSGPPALVADCRAACESVGSERGSGNQTVFRAGSFDMSVV